MAAVRFDTLDYARKLERAGVPKEQAAMQAEALGEALASTHDFHDEFQALDSRFERLEAKVDAGFAAVDARFEQLETKLDAKIDGGDKKLDAKIDRIEAKLVARIEAFEVKILGKIATLHWMFGTMVAMFAAMLIQSLLRH